MRALNAEQLMNPSQDQEKAIWLTHVFLAWNELRFLHWTMLQCQIVVINGKDLILRAIDQ